MTKPIPLSRAATAVAAILGFCLLASACPAAAFKAPSKASGGENTPLNLAPVTSPHTTSSGGASIVRTIVGLAIVIAVIWGLSWILRQVKSGRDPHTPAGGLQSVAALTLSAGRSVHLVRVGEDYVLLGSAEHGVVPIQRYTAQQAREVGLLNLDQPVARTRRSLLSTTAAGESGVRQPNQPDPMRAPSPSRNLIERMRELTVRR
jgi:flagellar protein FliO/FliZ